MAQWGGGGGIGGKIKFVKCVPECIIYSPVVPVGDISKSLELEGLSLCLRRVGSREGRGEH